MPSPNRTSHWWETHSDRTFSLASGEFSGAVQKTKKTYSWSYTRGISKAEMRRLHEILSNVVDEGSSASASRSCFDFSSTQPLKPDSANRSGVDGHGRRPYDAGQVSSLLVIASRRRPGRSGGDLSAAPFDCAAGKRPPLESAKGARVSGCERRARNDRRRGVRTLLPVRLRVGPGRWRLLLGPQGGGTGFGTFLVRPCSAR